MRWRSPTWHQALMIKVHLPPAHLASCPSKWEVREARWYFSARCTTSLPPGMPVRWFNSNCMLIGIYEMHVTLGIIFVVKSYL